MRRLKVFITVDTEASLSPGIQTTPGDLSRLYERDMLGRTPEGDFGVMYQLELLKRYGVNASFFIDPMFADFMGVAHLAQLIRRIQSAGQSVQMHIHTEWLERGKTPGLPERTGNNIADFTFAEQISLLQHAKALLEDNGAATIRAFRAGNYGANLDTLRALASIGIDFDTSYNRCYLGRGCAIEAPALINHPVAIGGVIELPVSCFQDYPGHYRHVQLCAASWPELQAALLAAADGEWRSFVIVSHSFELLTGRKHSVRNRFNAAPDRITIRRFENLCRFLDKNRDRFETPLFDSLDPTEITSPAVAAHPPVTGFRRTMWRMVEQTARRVQNGRESRRLAASACELQPTL